MRHKSEVTEEHEVVTAPEEVAPVLAEPVLEAEVAEVTEMKAEVSTQPAAAEHGFREGIVSGLHGANEVEGEVIALVRDTASNLLRAGGALSGEAVNLTRELAGNAVSATAEVGSSVTGGAARVARGAIGGVVEVGSDLGHAASDLVRGTVQGVVSIGGEVGALADRAVNGTLATANVLARGTIVTVRDTATTAIDAVGTVGKGVVTTATGLLVGLVGGAKEVLNSALPTRHVDQP